MSEQYYTLAPWRVREGKQDEFIDAWRELGEVFLALPKPPGKGALLQSLDDPQQFYSFGPWNALEDIADMRSDARAGEALERLRDLCESAKPGTFRLVLTVGESDAAVSSEVLVGRSVDVAQRSRSSKEYILLA